MMNAFAHADDPKKRITSGDKIPNEHAQTFIVCPSFGISELPEKS
jgi:hypothetical protein